MRTEESLENRLESGDPRDRLLAIKALMEDPGPGAADLLSRRWPCETHGTVRCALIIAVARVGGPGAFPLLVQACEDPDPEVRLRAVRALAAGGDRRMFPVLVRRLGHDSDQQVRDIAAHRLLEEGDGAFLEILGGMMEAPETGDQEAAVLACTRFNTSLVVPVLARAARGARLKEKACEALGRLAGMGNRNAFEVLASLQGHDPAPGPGPIDAAPTAGAAGAAADLQESYLGKLRIGNEYEDLPVLDADPAGGSPAPGPAVEARRRPTGRSRKAGADGELIPGGDPPGEPGSGITPEVPPRPISHHSKELEGGMVADTGLLLRARDRSELRRREEPLQVPCPGCRQRIPERARKCRFCGHGLVPSGLESVPASTRSLPPMLALGGLLTLGACGYAVSTGLSALRNPGELPWFLAWAMAGWGASTVLAVAGTLRGSGLAWWGWVALTVIGLPGTALVPDVRNLAPVLLFALGVLRTRRVRYHCTR